MLRPLFLAQLQQQHGKAAARLLARIARHDILILPHGRIVLALQRQGAGIVQLGVGIGSIRIDLLQLQEEGLRRRTVAREHFCSRHAFQQCRIIGAQRPGHGAFIQFHRVGEAAHLDAFLGQGALGIGGSDRRDLPLLFAKAAAGIGHIHHIIGEAPGRRAGPHVRQEREDGISRPAERRQYSNRQNPEKGPAGADDVIGQRQIDNQGGKADAI